jgi:alcohol dehydrogenase class IV
MIDPSATFNFFMPVELSFGPGSLQTLAEKAAPLGAKAFIVTGKSSAQASGALARTQNQLPGAILFDGVDENPSTQICDEGAARCKREACDFVVAIGGGSAIDVAKAICGLARNEGTCVDYFGSETFSAGALPLTAIPTTAGAGSEATPYAVITDVSTNSKRSISCRCLYPRLAILDPELTRSLPPSITAHAGLDALSQAMEGVVSKKATPPSTVLAMEATRLIKKWLPVAVNDGNHTEARSQMLYAAMLAGAVIAQTGTTLIHGMGYPLTTEWGIPHGLANALLMTPLFQFNARHMPSEVAALADALGHPCSTDPHDAASAIGQQIHALLADLAISPSGRDHGFQRNRLESFAAAIASDPYRFRNQPGAISQDLIARFYTQALEGVV